jgi:hypothetical protein
MQMKKKLAMVAIAAAVLLGATAPVSAASICDFEPTSFDVWLIQQFVCH